MKKVALCFPLGLVLAAALGGCRTPEGGGGGSTSETVQVDDEVMLPCTCGSPETAFSGCVNELCVSGEGNPDNPDCVCGPLSYEQDRSAGGSK